MEAPLKTETTTTSSSPNAVHLAFIRAQQRVQKLLDDSTPHIGPRWVFTGIWALTYCIRVAIVQGWHIVTYALGIYLLNIFIAFLSPRIDPALEMEEDSGPGLPMKNDEEFRPFIRRLPEFKFWLSATRAIMAGFFCTFFEVFNVPVFWPILVMYFLVLFGVTMKRQIKHMLKYRYIPFSYGKRKYKGKDDTGKVVASK
eukprot:Colp12_sorted_trinity150504_noHs@5024